MRNKFTEKKGENFVGRRVDRGEGCVKVGVIESKPNEEIDMSKYRIEYTDMVSEEILNDYETLKSYYEAY